MAEFRTFIAVPISEPQRLALAALLHDLSPGAGPTVRWVQPTLMHVTLAFLGDLPADVALKVCDIAEEVASRVESFSWTLDGLGAFPSLDRAAILWAGVHEPAGLMTKLHADLENGLRPIGYQLENRPFRPHITLGRVARGRRLVPVVRTALAADWKGPTARADGIEVISSVLGPKGPQYNVLRHCPLA